MVGAAAIATQNAGVTGFDVQKPMKLPDGTVLQPYSPSSEPSKVATAPKVSIGDRIGQAEVRIVETIKKDYALSVKALDKLLHDIFASKPPATYLVVNNGASLQESQPPLPITGLPGSQNMTSWIPQQQQTIQDRLNGGSN